jgi:hypothetical protein
MVFRRRMGPGDSGRLTSNPYVGLRPTEKFRLRLQDRIAYGVDRQFLHQKSKLREKQAHVDILDQCCNSRRRRVCALVFARYDPIASLIGAISKSGEVPEAGADVGIAEKSITAPCLSSSRH